MGSHLWHRMPRRSVAYLVAAALFLVAAVSSCGTTGHRSVASPTAASKLPTGHGSPAARLVLVLAKNLGVTAPQWSGKVLAGPPCGPKADVFCPIGIAATPDGKLVALADLAGRLKVVNTVTGKTLLDKTLPVPANFTTATVGVWISPNGRWASRDLTVLSSSGKTSTIGFGIWDVATGHALVRNGPTVKSPWLPLQNVAFGSGHSALLAFDEGVPRDLWLVASITGGTIRFLKKYDSPVQPDEILYSQPQSSWVAMWRDGYALWSATTGVHGVRFPACRRALSTAIDADGGQIACDADGDPIKGSHLVNVWDTATGKLSSRVATGTHGAVRQIAFLDSGHSIALTAGADTYDSTKKSLLVLSLYPRPVLRSVTSLPGVSAGWSLLALGGLVVALGASVKGGYCCVAVTGAP